MITLSKIAKLAYVSVSTASKAFAMSPEVNPETREKIFAIAKQYGVFNKYYHAKYPKYVIAVICPEFEGRDYSTALSALQKFLFHYNCEVTVASTDFSAKSQSELLEYYNLYTAVDGIILFDCQTPLQSYGEIPIAGISCAETPNASISVVCRKEPVLQQLLTSFLENGIFEIGFIGESHTKQTHRQIQTILAQSGHPLQDKFVCISEQRFEAGGYAAAKQLLSGSNLPQVLLCAYDNMAIGAMRCFADNGISVPQDVAIIGMGNIHESAFLSPPLATIDNRLEQACIAAANALINCLKGNAFETSIVIQSEYVPRPSAQL